MHDLDSSRCRLDNFPLFKQAKLILVETCGNETQFKVQVQRQRALTKRNTLAAVYRPAPKSG